MLRFFYLFLLLKTNTQLNSSYRFYSLWLCFLFLFLDLGCAKFPDISFNLSDTPKLELKNINIITNNSQATIRWDTNSHFTFNVYRSLSSGFSPSPENLLASDIEANASYTDTDVLNGIRYFYRISSFNNQQEIIYSPEISILMPPSEPVLEHPNITHTSVRLDWAYVTGADLYYIYRSTSNPIQMTHDNVLAYINTNHYIDTSISPGTRYYYTLLSWNSSTHSTSNGYSTLTSETFNILTYTHPPTPLSLSSDNTLVSFNWNTSTGAVSYNLYKHNTPSLEMDSASKLNSTPITGTSYTENNLENGTHYYYLLTSLNEGDMESLPTQENILTVPSSPTTIYSTMSHSSIELTWNTSPGATLYYIYRSESLPVQTIGNPYTFSTSTSNYTDPFTVPNTRYYYTLLAWNSASHSSSNGYSTLGSRTLEILTYPAMTGLSHTVSPGTDPSQTNINLSWFPAYNGATEYILYRSTSPVVLTTPNNIINNISIIGTSYTDTLPNDGQTYYYVITNRNTSGESQPSYPSSVTLPSAAPVLLVPSLANNNSNHVSLNWSSPITSITYRILISTSPTFSTSTNIDINTTTRTFTNLNENTTYYFKVYASNSILNSDFSNIQSITLPYLAPTITSISSITGNASSGLSQLYINFQTISPNSVLRNRYFVYRDIQENFIPGASNLIGSVTSPPYIDTTLPMDGRRYTYKIIGNMNSFSTTPSEPSTVLSLPPIPIVSISSNTLSWASSFSAISYKIYKGRTPTFIPSNEINFLTSITDNLGTPFYVDNNYYINKNDTFYYKVIAVNSAGNSIPSNTVVFNYIFPFLSSSIYWASANNTTPLPLTIHTSLPWTVQYNTLSWVTLSQINGTNSSTININLSLNHLILPRAAKIPILSNNFVMWLTINQYPLYNSSDTSGPSEIFQLPYNISTVWFTLYAGDGGNGADGVSNTCGGSGDTGSQGSPGDRTICKINVSPNTNLSYFIGNRGINAINTHGASEALYGGSAGFDAETPISISNIGCPGYNITTPSIGGGGGSGGGHTSITYNNTFFHVTGGKGGGGGNGQGIGFKDGGAGGETPSLINTLVCESQSVPPSRTGNNNRGLIIVRY